MLKKSKTLFEQWNEAFVCYCHWKSNEHLREGLDGLTDLDVLIDRKDKEKGIAILKALDYMYCKSQFGSKYSDVEDWIGFDEDTGNLIHVHLHYCMITGHKGMKEYHLPWTKDVLQTRILDKKTGVYVSDPNLEIITLYSRIGLKATAKQISKAKKRKYIIGDDYIKEINFLKEIIQWSKVYVYLQKYFEKDSDSLLVIMKSDIFESTHFLQLKEIVMKSLSSYSQYSRFGVMVRELFYRVTQKLLLWLKYKKRFPIIMRKTPANHVGLTIAFLGQDGAGKSTVTADIEEWLRWKLDATKFYLGSGEHFKPWEKKLQAKMKNTTVYIKPIRAFLLLRTYIKLSKSVYNTIRRANLYSSKGGVALFDRYPQILYSGINDGPKVKSVFSDRVNNRLLKFVVEYFSRKEEKNLSKAVEYNPDIVIKLLLPPEESLKRKPEEDPIMVMRKHEIVKSIDFKFSKVYEIDATQKYEDELLQIKEIIWNNMQNNEN